MPLKKLLLQSYALAASIVILPELRSFHCTSRTLGFAMNAMPGGQLTQLSTLDLTHNLESSWQGMACQRTAISLSTLINSAMFLSNCNESSLRSCSALWETNPKWCRFAEAPHVRPDHAGLVHSLPDSFTMRHALGNNGTVSGRAPLGAGFAFRTARRSADNGMAIRARVCGW